MAGAQIKVDGLDMAIEKLNIQNGDVVVVKGGADMAFELLEVLRNMLPGKVQVVYLPEGMVIEALDEEAMGHCGWFRGKHGAN